MFPEGGGKEVDGGAETFLTTLSEIKWSLAWFVCPGPHVFMCVPPRRVFIMFRVCVWTQQDPWEGWIYFPFSLRLLDSAPHLFFWSEVL